MTYETSHSSNFVVLCQVRFTEFPSSGLDVAGSQHFALELSAAHANEMGALTVLFLALPATAVEPLEAQSLDALYKFAASLRSVGDVVGKPRSGFGLKPAIPNQATVSS